MAKNMKDMFDNMDDGDGDEPTEKSKPKGKKPPRFARPGEGDVSKRKPIPRGEPFTPKESLTSWSTR